MSANYAFLMLNNCLMLEELFIPEPYEGDGQRCRTELYALPAEIQAGI